MGVRSLDVLASQPAGFRRRTKSILVLRQQVSMNSRFCQGKRPDFGLKLDFFVTSPYNLPDL